MRGRFYRPLRIYYQQGLIRRPFPRSDGLVELVPVLGEARPCGPCSRCRERLYSSRSTPSEEKQVGHSEGIMRPLMLALGATLLVGVPALIALGPVLLLAQVQPQELKHGVTATGLDFAPLLFGLAAVLLIGAALGVVFATRAQRRRERQSEEGRMAPKNAREVALARWIEEGRQLFNIWQERVERFDELQGRLAAMAQEIGQLSSRIDELRAENRHLSEQGEALLLERDQLRSVLARIGELIQRASEARRGPAGEATAPEVGP